MRGWSRRDAKGDAMFRWLRELVSPSDKCKRLGHDPESRTMSGYQMPSEGFRGVADEVTVRYEACRRCGEMLTTRDDFEVVRRHTLHSLTLPSRSMRTLEDTGVLWDHQI